jgi:diaminopimelate decarboxylase
MCEPVATDEKPVEALRRVAQTYGTPTYAYDVSRLRTQVDRLRANLPQEIDLLYSLKANPSLGLCGLMADWGLGADVASAGELLVALKSGMPPGRIFVNGPHKSLETLAYLQDVPEAVLSVDSVSEVEKLAHTDRPHRIILRLRPDYASSACCVVGPDSRFGIRFEELAACREVLASRSVEASGFHVFSGSQMSDATTVIDQLLRATDLSLRAADALRMTPDLVNLGGGFGIPYKTGHKELDLVRIGNALSGIVDRVKPARVVIELGRYLVAQAGWYLTTVVGFQSYRGRQAAVVDGGIHHRSDICGLGVFAGGLSPLVISGGNDPVRPTDVLGCLCLPHDALVESGMLPQLSPGDVLAFPNGGAYGLSASPGSFLSHSAPPEVAFEGITIELLRARQPVEALLAGQSRLRCFGGSSPASRKIDLAHEAV